MKSAKLRFGLGVFWVAIGLLQVFGPNPSPGLALIYGLLAGSDLQEALDIWSANRRKRVKPMIACDLAQPPNRNVCTSNKCCQQEET